MSNRAKLEVVATSAVAGTVGLTTWVLTMANAKRYSYAPDQDMGNLALYPVLIGSAIIGGFIVPRRATLVGMALGLPSLILSPWTAPRGDNDGLWILIVPLLAILVVLLVRAASAGRWARAQLTSP
jgi:hypothetical protein